MSSTNIAIKENFALPGGHRQLGVIIGSMPTQFENTLGKRVRLLRQDLGLNQEELQERMQKLAGVRVGQGYISDIERDKATPSWQVIAGLAKALNTTSDYLMLLTDVSRGQNDHIDTITTEAVSAVRIIDSLPVVERERLLKVISAYDEDYRSYLRHMRKLEQIKESILLRGGETAWESVVEYIRTAGQAILDRESGGGTGNPFRHFLDDISE